MTIQMLFILFCISRVLFLFLTLLFFIFSLACFAASQVFISFVYIFAGSTSSRFLSLFFFSLRLLSLLRSYRVIIVINYSTSKMSLGIFLDEINVFLYIYIKHRFIIIII